MATFQVSYVTHSEQRKSVAINATDKVEATWSFWREHPNAKSIVEMKNSRTVVEKIKSFTMRREGQFLANWSSNETKCGPITAQPIYQYTCLIVTPPSLDRNGFIIDNLEVHQHFVDTYSQRIPAISCERMAANAVRSLLKKCERQDIQPVKIEVAISGMPGAWLTATYEA